MTDREGTPATIVPPETCSGNTGKAAGQPTFPECPPAERVLAIRHAEGYGGRDGAGRRVPDRIRDLWPRSRFRSEGRLHCPCGGPPAARQSVRIRLPLESYVTVFEAVPLPHFAEIR